MSKTTSMKIGASLVTLALFAGVAFVSAQHASAQTDYGTNRTPANTSTNSSTLNSSSSLTPSNSSTDSRSSSSSTGTGSTSGTSSGTSTTGGTSGTTNSSGTSGTTNSNSAGTTVTPGVPNTGFGGNALMNWIALFGSGLVAAAGITYLARYATGQ